MPESSVTLSVRNVTKRFGDFTAVEDLSFDVRAGRVFGFLGPNGAGKTTTIRMIVGITAPDEGS
ncbi:MAG TPA: ATP-binding cassette domain-containing protein, partial [Pyrinomonadaceae bacterium]